MEINSIEQLALRMYNAYLRECVGPPWRSLKPDTKRGWIAAAREAIDLLELIKGIA